MTATRRAKRAVIRRAIDQHLAARHAANSCDFCRRALPAGYLLELLAEGKRKFCNTDCRDDFDAAHAQAAVR